VVFSASQFDLRYVARPFYLGSEQSHGLAKPSLHTGLE